MYFKLINIDIFTIICVGFSLRAIISLHSYSGAGNPPMYGDYEAQRHWQEITVNVPVDSWYKNTSKNDLQYWGLDYPPLTAYHSYLMGLVAKDINRSYVELEESRGYESNNHKTFMRWTVLLCDLFIYIPAIVILGKTIEGVLKTNAWRPFIYLGLIYPGQILIDNGHFQYNNVSLGLAAFAISSILTDRHNLAAFFYTLALNYKQMELYHALPFFIYLLHTCFREKSFMGGCKKLFMIGGTVALTFITLWIPWLHSLDSIIALINRLFPLNRGVFEDKVANIWCAINVVYKLKSNFSHRQMALLCMGTTLAAVFPISVLLLKETTKRKFLYCLTNTAMAFFLFSFQVHEKSILLVTLPAICLFFIQPLEIFWFLGITIFSMFPLFMKDQLILPYFVLFFIFFISFNLVFIHNFSLYENKKFYCAYKLIAFSTGVMFAISLLAYIDVAPSKYPYLWSLIISLYSCFHFSGFFLINTWRNIKFFNSLKEQRPYIELIF